MNNWIITYITLKFSSTCIKLIYKWEKYWSKSILNAYILWILFTIYLCDNLNLCSPCLLHGFNCNNTNRCFSNTEYRQAIVFLVVRNIIAIILSINYSIRGQEFAPIIDDLRKLFNKLYKNGYQNQLSRINLFAIVLMILFVLFV
jgi:hypothetical protein